MKKVKQVVLFLLVVITLYSTMLFYLLMSVHADSRLQQIDYLEKIKQEQPHKVLYIDRLVPISQRLQHFSLSRVSHKEPRSKGCQFGQFRQGVLLIGASSFDPITIYSKVLRELQIGKESGCIPEVFVLKKLHPLILSSEQNINKYATEIGEVLKYFTIQAQFQLSILTHQEGALLTLVYFARKTINLLYHNVVQKIRAVILIDITHPFLRVQYDPPYKLLAMLKMEVMASRERVKIFNRLKFVIVTTHKEDGLKEHFFYKTPSTRFLFGRTLLISSRQMANVHYFLPPNSLSFPPLVRRLAQFIAKDFKSNYSVSEAHDILRYGQSYSYQRKREEELKECIDLSMAQENEALVRQGCVKMLPFQLQNEQALMMYSANHFQVYSNDYHRVYPFDNLTEGSIYLFQRMTYPLYIINPQTALIHLSRQKIASPSNPLDMDQDELLHSSQLLFTNYSVVRICPNVILTFPLHFAQGNIHRKFLGQGQQKCFTEESLFQNFSWQLFLNWSLFRNMVIFTLLCSILRKDAVTDRLVQQFSINMIILMSHEQVSSKITCGIYIQSFSILVEYLSRAILYVVSYFTIKENWGSFTLLAVSAICMAACFFDLFNYWKIFGVVVIFFINKQNLLLFIIKLYFIKEEFPYNSSGFDGITNLGILTMWLYTSLDNHKLPPADESSWTADQVFTTALLLAIAVGVDFPGSMIETIITIYMKLFIVLRMLRILRNRKQK